MQVPKTFSKMIVTLDEWKWFQFLLKEDE